jgi:hypothetical protein
MDENLEPQSARLAYIRAANRLAAATLPRTGPVAAHLGDLHRTRSCRYAARIGLKLTPQALSLESCRNVPDWIVWPLAVRTRLGLLTGVSILAPALAATMNGPLLRTVAAWTGMKPLTAMLDQPIGSPRPLPDKLDETTLSGIGAAAMRRLLPRPDALAWLLMLEADPQHDWIDDPETCRAHIAQAAGLIAQDERGAQS